MNAYLNYFNHEIKLPEDNLSVGLLLCTGSDEAAVRYALGGMDEKLFVSQYKLLLPDEATLRTFIERERDMMK
jgi:YhcG PDDEXK nuclease domain